MVATQQNAPLDVETVLGADAFQLRSLEWQETIGAPFEGTLNLLSERESIDLNAMLKTPVAVRIDTPSGDPTWLQGYINRIENLGPDRRLFRYRATVVPCISLLKHSGGCRIFQGFSTIDIIKKIFLDFGFSGQLESRVTCEYAKREYCVQYCESDFNFLSRVLQEEGIYYFYEYSQEKHCMVLADDVQSHRSAPGNENIEFRPDSNTRLDEYLTDFRTTKQFGIGAVELGDYDFQKPRSPLRTKQISAEGDANWNMYHYPGNFSDTDRGEELAKVRQQSVDAASVCVSMRGTARSIRTGNVFSLLSHPIAENNSEYLITRMGIRAQLGGLQTGNDASFRFEMQLDSQASKIPYRPELTAHPTFVRGPHVAVVTGKEGEEIWTDEYGRIKVQFPWDPDGKSNEQSSCWIRVAQAWTGKTWGAMSLPRIGEEVIVEFLDGDPNRPIVVGRVYNADMMPPEALAAAQAKTIFRTHSTKGGDKNAFHELTFDDTKDSESIYLHSERDFKRVVENDDETLIGFEKKSPGNHKLSVYNDSEIEIGVGSGEGSLKVEVQKDRTVNVESGDDTLSIAQGDQNTTVKQGDLNIKVSAGNTTIDAGQSIKLSCGASSITIKPDAIEISATTINVNASGELKLNGLQGTLSSSGPLTLKGAIVQIN